MFSYAYAVQMNLDVPDAEKRVAEKASEAFESVMAQLKLTSEKLDLISVPFSKVQRLDSEEVVENRAMLRKYRDEIKNLFDTTFKTAYSAVSLMSEFATDSAVEELMQSFVSALRELEKQDNYFLSIFSNLNSPEFKDTLLLSVDAVKRQGSQLKQLINDRVLEYIDTNILAKNWESLVNDQYKDKLKSKTPLLVQLFKERQNAI